jgi:hypothetical protein
MLPARFAASAQFFAGGQLADKQKECFAAEVRGLQDRRAPLAL